MNSSTNIQVPTLLLCTNGNPASRPALEYGVWLASTLKAPVFLLGVIESGSQADPVDRLMRETIEQLKEAGVPHQADLDRGRASIVISRWAATGRFLTVVGRLGRPAWRVVVQGRSFRRLLEKIESPILYVPQARLPLRRILICMGGLNYASGMEHLILYLAQAVQAQVTLLHVVEPINLDYPVARRTQLHWKEILETDTPQGNNLRQALIEARQAGVETTFKVRQGSAVHEILDEVHTGDYDLVGMGSPYSAHSLRRLYMPNVTAEVAESLELPVLAVRKGHALVE